MRIKVELLRDIEYTKKDLENYLNLEEIDEFSELDQEMMEEFKKSYELGLNQLEKFIKKLDEEGKDLDVYTIKYYVGQLLRGPLSGFAKEFFKDKNYYQPTPDTLGINGNNIFSPQNTTVLETYDYPLGVSNELYNKLPRFAQDLLTNSIEQSEEVFRSGLGSFTSYDNTRPVIDKENETRYSKEAEGTLVLDPIANFMIKDSYYKKVLEEVNKTLYDKIEEFLGEEDFRLFEDGKSYNPFDDENDSVSENFELKKNIQEGEEEKELSLDLLGNMFDSFERRESTLKIETDSGNEEYKLNTNEGQLGN